MATRGGLSISLKMIITTTLLIVMIVGIFGFIAILSTKDLYDEQAKRQQQIFEQTTREHGSSQIETLAEGILGPLKGTEFEVIHPMLIRARQHDVLVRHIWLLDQAGRRVASSYKSANDTFNKQWANDHTAIKPFGHVLLPKEFTAKVSGAARTGTGATAQPPPMVTPMKAPPPMTAEPKATDTLSAGAMSAGTVSAKSAPIRPAAVATARQTYGAKALIRDYKGERVMVVGKPLVALGVFMGSVYVVYSMERLKEQQTRIQNRKEKAFAQQWQRTAMIGGVFVLVGLLLAIMQGIRISKPIRILSARVSQIAQGELQTRVEVTTSDELGVLAENFNFMADQLMILLQETAQQGAVAKELEVARTIQEALVPSSEIVDRPFLRLSGYFEPASECGGDWWTFHDLEDGKVLVVIADVTGHGVPSAMITATAKSAVDTLRAVTNDNLTVTYLLEILNRAILESAKRKFVMTCFASIIDPKEGTITFANAGHNFPYIYREEGGQGKFNVLMTRGNRLGDMEESTYQAKKEDIKPGDTIVWYTDGVVECENEIGEEYGEKRFRNSIRKLAGKEPDEVRDGVMSAADTFYGDMPHKDDITMVIGKFYEPGTAPPLPGDPTQGDDDAADGAQTPTDGTAEGGEPTPVKEAEA
jgi:serine phosphatase RsbU (regulator of sigma subunit)